MGCTVDGMHEHWRVQYDPNHIVNLNENLTSRVTFKHMLLASLVGLLYMLSRIPGEST